MLSHRKFGALNLGKRRTCEHVKPSYHGRKTLSFRLNHFLALQLSTEFTHAMFRTATSTLAASVMNIYSLSSGRSHCAILCENRAVGHFFRATYWLHWFSFTLTEPPFNIAATILFLFHGMTFYAANSMFV